MNKGLNLGLILIIAITLFTFANSLTNAAMQEIKKDQIPTKEKIIKPNETQGEELKEKSEITKDEKIFETAINVYRDTIDFYKWTIWLFMAVMAIFGIFIYSRYKALDKKTQQGISDLHEEAKEKLGKLERIVGEEALKIEIVAKIFMGISLIFQGRTYESIPLLEGALANRQDLTDQQLIIIHFTLGNLYCDMQNTALASAHSLEAIQINPNLSYARLIHARALQLQGDFSGALNEIKTVENLAAKENYLPDAFATLYMFHGNLLIQMQKFIESREKFESAKNLIEERMLQVPLGSPQLLMLSQAKAGAENGLIYLEIRELLKEIFDIEPSPEEVSNLISWMRSLPYANKIEDVYQIFEDKDFISQLEKVFNEVLSRPPETWEILKYGDRWLAKQQEKKEIPDIIREELKNCSEFIKKKESEKKFKNLLKK